MFRSAVKDVRSDNEDEDEEVEMVEGPVGTTAGLGLEQRQGQGRVEVNGGEEWKEGDEALLLLGRGNGRVVGGGDGDAGVEKLDEYVDIGHEEKKDR